jgi:cytochrome c oxidase subunit IV
VEHPETSNLTWGQRHGLTVILVVMGLLFVLVIVVQTLT